MRQHPRFGGREPPPSGLPGAVWSGCQGRPPRALREDESVTSPRGGGGPQSCPPAAGLSSRAFPSAPRGTQTPSCLAAPGLTLREWLPRGGPQRESPGRPRRRGPRAPMCTERAWARRPGSPHPRPSPAEPRQCARPAVNSNRAIHLFLWKTF